MKPLILVLCAIKTIVETTPVPGPFPQICKPVDDLECNKEAAAKAIPIIADGLPEYGVARTDPLFTDKIDASTNNLKLVLHNTTMTGLKHCKPKKVQFDIAKNKVNIKLLCDANLDGYYVMKGSVLVLPIEGKGKIHVGLNKVLIDFDIGVDTISKAGKNYLKLTDWKYKYELRGKSKLEFDGLFNGNELLARAARDLIANNGNEVILEIGAPAIKTLATRVVTTVKKLLDHIPLEDVFVKT